ncbi:MAG: VanW family protein [Deltaproteobacteria bacterium]|jgi:vancomycin resistance protein YoaR|nr:VanW family protein [Deltaproteobacteria bacterium]MBW2536785.1 VanW family protein [Deltaproteobacteria bacterium]
MGRSERQRAADDVADAPDSNRRDAECGPGSGRDAHKGARTRRRLVAGLVVPLLIVVAAFGFDRLTSRGSVLRGVHLGGVDVGGLDAVAVAREIRLLSAGLRTASLPVRVAERAFELDPAEIDFEVDVEASADAALRAGRGGSWFAQLSWWFGRWLGPARLPLAAQVDDSALETVVAAWEEEAIADPPFEGAVSAKDGELAADYPRAGRAIDREALRPLLVDALVTESRRELTVPLSRAEPKRGRAVVDQALAAARKLVDGPVLLTTPAPVDQERPDEGRAEDEDDDEPETPKEIEIRFSPAQLIRALRTRFQSGDDLALELYFDAEIINGALGDLRKAVERPPRDAAFVIGKRDRVTIRPSSPGRLIDAERVAEAVLEAARSPKRRGELPVRDGEPPELSTEQARELGIVELVGKFSTHHPCCKPRVENIHRIADLVDGTLVQPGETFSLNELVGQRTTKKGFVLAPGIEEGEMVDSVGGGISQFATTLFNAVLYAGYDVVERAPHTWYFKRYPMGFDATLSFPEPDLKFRNDTKAGLLIKTEHSATTITVKLFGDAEGRKVKTKKSHPTDVVQPPIKYIADSSLEPDESKTKYNGRVGWSVYVSRTVTYRDGQDKTQRRKITYNPRPKELRVHPCKIPKGEEGYTGKPCPEPEEPEEDEEGDGDDATADEPKPPRRFPKAPPPPPEEPDEPPPSADELIPPSLLDGEG